MKNIIITIVFAAMAFAGPGARAEVQRGGDRGNTEVVVFDVNVHCANCKAKLERRIPFEKGVKDMEVDLENQQVTVKFDKRKNSVEKIAEAIGDLGYTVRVAEPEE